MEKKLMGAMEAVLFAMGKPVKAEALAKALNCDISMVFETAEALKHAYEQEDRGIELAELEDSYQLRTKNIYYQNLITIALMPEKPTLTSAMMETLAIVAYKQPVTRTEISLIRGVSSDHAVSRLVEYGLVEEAGRLNAPGRPILFRTTDEFLRRFGMSSLEKLPPAGEFKTEEANGVAEEKEEIIKEEITV